MNFFEHLKGLFSSKIEYSKGIYALFKLEAKLAGLNLPSLLVGLIVLFVLTFTLWLSAMVLIGYEIYHLTQQPLTAISIIILVNLGLAIYFIVDIKHRLQQMSFARTRDCLKTPEEGNDRESEERAIEIHNQAGGKS